LQVKKSELTDYGPEIGLALVIRFAHPLFLKVFRIYDRLNNVVQENLQGVRVVKSYVREEQQEELFGEVSTDVYRNFTLAQRIVSFNMPLMQFAVYTCMLLLSWFGAQLIVEQSSLTTGELVSMFNYTMQILMSLMMMSMAFVQILIARTSAERVRRNRLCRRLRAKPAEAIAAVRPPSVPKSNAIKEHKKSKPPSFRITPASPFSIPWSIIMAMIRGIMTSKATSPATYTGVSKLSFL